APVPLSLQYVSLHCRLDSTTRKAAGEGQTQMPCYWLLRHSHIMINRLRRAETASDLAKVQLNQVPKLGGRPWFGRHCFKQLVSQEEIRIHSFDAGQKKTPFLIPLCASPHFPFLSLAIKSYHFLIRFAYVCRFVDEYGCFRGVDAALLIESNALLCGILTDKDVAIRVIANELSLEETPVSKVMTRNPVFVLSDTLAVEALQKMLQGKFRHLPVEKNGEVIALLDIAKCLYDAITRMERIAEKGKAIAAAVEGVEKQWGTSIPSPNTFLESFGRECSGHVYPQFYQVVQNGNIVSVIDVIDASHAAIARVESSGGLGTESTAAIMQKFWDSAMAMGPSDEDEESRSETSMKFASEADTSSSPAFTFSGVSTGFSFKLEDNKGRMHRFNCDTRSMADLITCILQQAGDDIDKNNLLQILYEDEDHDKIVLSSDGDLAAAVDHARLAGWKGLRLHLDFSGSEVAANVKRDLDRIGFLDHEEVMSLFHLQIFEVFFC
ncbi:hypothetical protein HPP92_027119, partial [Vanilla planifolia]